LTVRLVAGVMLVSVCGTPPAPPIIATPIAATLVGGSLVLDGARFGERDPSSELVYVGRTTPSTDPTVTAWADTSITVVLPASARSGPLAVQTADGTSLPVQLEVYAYDFFAMPPTPISRPGSAPPEAAEAGTMPTQNGLGLDEDDRSTPRRQPPPAPMFGMSWRTDSHEKSDLRRYSAIVGFPDASVSFDTR
jgi:hypothetical protein